MSDEVRVKDPVTGGEKGSKLARYDLIPAEPLRLLAEHYGRGAQKYEDRNWERGYRWSLSFAALNRHLWAFWNGEDVDPETGSLHMTAVAWHAFALLEYAQRHLGTDDRPHAGEAQALRWADWINRTDRAHDPLFVGRPGPDGRPAVSNSGPVLGNAPGASYEPDYAQMGRDLADFER